MRIVREKMLYQLTFLPRFFPVNCYLVEEKDSLTLIDAALPYSASGILKAADQIGKPITRIVFTHTHEDHIGAIDNLKKRLPNASVYMSQRDYRLFSGDFTLDSEEPQNPIRGGIPKLGKVSTKIDHFIQEDSYIGSLAPIFTPGHTPGSMSFLDQRTNALIAGDSFQVRGGIAVSGQLKPLFPFPAFGTWSKELALKSAEKLHELNPSLLAVGHGKILSQPLKLMGKAIQQAKVKIEKRR
ncbi:MBL fold metallo-hydrolase [Priestia megaterium]|uniref:MBL fold metallo-hydrolase n=1 Tax=Priestia megaterium TaxID=1404 RepID=UPI00298C129F|nr:MBL fold metallo-hydrolase [Priestia megaterium]